MFKPEEKKSVHYIVGLFFSDNQNPKDKMKLEQSLSPENLKNFQKGCELKAFDDSNGKDSNLEPSNKNENIQIKKNKP
jgi:hypothetical protein